MKPSGFSLGAAHGVRKRKSSGDVVGGGAMEGGGGRLCYSSGRCLCDASLLGICWGVLCTALTPRRGGLHAGPWGWELLECAGGLIGTCSPNWNW